MIFKKYIFTLYILYMDDLLGNINMRDKIQSAINDGLELEVRFRKNPEYIRKKDGNKYEFNTVGAITVSDYNKIHNLITSKQHEKIYMSEKTLQEQVTPEGNRIKHLLVTQLQKSHPVYFDKPSSIINRILDKGYYKGDTHANVNHPKGPEYVKRLGSDTELFNSNDFKQIGKMKAEVEREDDYSNYGFRVALSKEQERSIANIKDNIRFVSTDLRTEKEIVRYLVKDSNDMWDVTKDKSTFGKIANRIKYRHTYYDTYWRHDLTKIYTYIDNVYSRTDHQLEIELLNNNAKDNIDAAVNELRGILYKYLNVIQEPIENINKAVNSIDYINSTDYLITKNILNQVASNYHILLGKNKIVDKGFIGALPRAVTTENMEYITDDYYYTVKADGMRYMLYIDPNGDNYLINRKFNIYNININTPGYKNSLFDTELVHTHSNDYVILVFDVLIMQNDNKIGKHLMTGDDSRIKLYEQYIDSVQLKELEHIKIRAKEYNQVLPNNYGLNEEYDFNTDGYIFTPSSKYLLRSDTKSEKDVVQVYKWKPYDMNSVDLLVKKEDGRNYLYLLTNTYKLEALKTTDDNRSVFNQQKGIFKKRGERIATLIYIDKANSTAILLTDKDNIISLHMDIILDAPHYSRRSKLLRLNDMRDTRKERSIFFFNEYTVGLSNDFGILSDNYDNIENNVVIECRYDFNSRNMIPLIEDNKIRTRYDKDKPNFITVVIDDFSSMTNARVELKHIFNTENRNAAILESEQIGERGNVKNMRKYHNHIKKELLWTYAKYNDNLLDIGTYKCGDQDKWNYCGIQRALGTDIKIQPEAKNRVLSRQSDKEWNAITNNIKANFVDVLLYEVRRKYGVAIIPKNFKFLQTIVTGYYTQNNDGKQIAIFDDKVDIDKRNVIAKANGQNTYDDEKMEITDENKEYIEGYDFEDNDSTYIKIDNTYDKNTYNQLRNLYRTREKLTIKYENGMEVDRIMKDTRNIYINITGDDDITEQIEKDLISLVDKKIFVNDFNTKYEVDLKNNINYSVKDVVGYYYTSIKFPLFNRIAPKLRNTIPCRKPTYQTKTHVKLLQVSGSGHNSFRTYFKEISDIDFNVITSNFVIHYMFKSELELQHLFGNISEYLRDGGYFICTLLDGDKIIERFNNNEGRDMFEERDNDGKLIYRIQKDWVNGENVDDFGQIVNIELGDTHYQSSTEWIAKSRVLIDMAKKYNLNVVEHDTFDIFENLYEKKNAKRSKRFYLSGPEKGYSYLNKYYVFVKDGPSGLQDKYKKYDIINKTRNIANNKLDNVDSDIMFGSKMLEFDDLSKYNRTIIDTNPIFKKQVKKTVLDLIMRTDVSNFRVLGPIPDKIADYEYNVYSSQLTQQIQIEKLVEAIQNKNTKDYIIKQLVDINYRDNYMTMLNSEDLFKNLINEYSNLTKAVSVINQHYLYSGNNMLVKLPEKVQKEKIKIPKNIIMLRHSHTYDRYAIDSYNLFNALEYQTSIVNSRASKIYTEKYNHPLYEYTENKAEGIKLFMDIVKNSSNVLDLEPEEQIRKQNSLVFLLNFANGVPNTGFSDIPFIMDVDKDYYDKVVKYREDNDNIEGLDYVIIAWIPDLAFIHKGEKLRHYKYDNKVDERKMGHYEIILLKQPTKQFYQFNMTTTASGMTSLEKKMIPIIDHIYKAYNTGRTEANMLYKPAKLDKYKDLQEANIVKQKQAAFETKEVIQEIKQERKEGIPVQYNFCIPSDEPTNKNTFEYMLWYLGYDAPLGSLFNIPPGKYKAALSDRDISSMSINDVIQIIGVDKEENIKKSFTTARFKTKTVSDKLDDLKTVIPKPYKEIIFSDVNGKFDKNLTIRIINKFTGETDTELNKHYNKYNGDKECNAEYYGQEILNDININVEDYDALKVLRDDYEVPETYKTKKGTHSYIAKRKQYGYGEQVSVLKVRDEHKLAVLRYKIKYLLVDKEGMYNDMKLVFAGMDKNRIKLYQNGIPDDRLTEEIRKKLK